MLYSVGTFLAMYGRLFLVAASTPNRDASDPQATKAYELGKHIFHGHRTTAGKGYELRVFASDSFDTCL